MRHERWWSEEGSEVRREPQDSGPQGSLLEDYQILDLQIPKTPRLSRLGWNSYGKDRIKPSIQLGRLDVRGIEAVRRTVSRASMRRARASERARYISRPSMMY